MPWDGPDTTGSEALVVNYNGWYMYGHNSRCTNVKLADVLDQIAAFMLAHPKEIVILSGGIISQYQAA